MLASVWQQWVREGGGQGGAGLRALWDNRVGESKRANKHACAHKHDGLHGRACSCTLAEVGCGARVVGKAAQDVSMYALCDNEVGAQRDHERCGTTGRHGARESERASTCLPVWQWGAGREWWAMRRGREHGMRTVQVQCNNEVGEGG